MSPAMTFPMGDSGCAEMLARATDASGQGGRPQKMLPAAERAKALAEKIRAYIRGERRKRSAVDLCASVAEAMDMVRESLAAGIELQAHLPAQPVHVMAEAIELHQVVTILCGNAAQSLAGGGTIGVTVKAVEASKDGTFPRVMLPSARYALLKVKDTGSGVDARNAALSQVQAIVTDLGGAIEMAAKPGLGTMFTIWLPAAEPAAA